MDYDHILSKRVTAIKPSGIRRFFDLLNDMTDGISLGIGEPDFVNAHAHPAGGHRLPLKRADKIHLQLRHSRAARGHRPAIWRRASAFRIAPGQMVITVGGSEAIDLALRASGAGGRSDRAHALFVCYGPLTSIAAAAPWSSSCAMRTISA
jgi:aminotransferase